MPDYSTMAPGVYLEEVSGVRPISGVGTALLAILGLAPQGPAEPTFVANWSQYVQTYGGITPGMTLGRAVYAYIANGGGGCLVVRVGGAGEGGAKTATVVLHAADGADALVLTAKQPGKAGNDISVEVATAAASGSAGTSGGSSAAGGGDAGAGTAEGEAAPVAPSAGGASDDTFDLVVTVAKNPPERYAGLTPETALAQLGRSKLVGATAPGSGAVRRPADGTAKLTGGASGETVTAASFIGDEAQGTGLAALAAQDEVTMVAAPDVVTLLQSGAMTAADVAAVHTALVDHCDVLGDRMAILDPPFAAGDSGGPMSPQEMSSWRDGIASSKFATTYYPWVQVHDALSGTLLAQPPSGFVAGAWARNDYENGVGSAPVGRVRGVVGLARQVTDTDQGLLNPRGVNCLRVFRGEGVRIWGARTLSPDAEWKYVNVRRLFNFIEESVVEGTRFAVFEPNDRDLWARLRRSVEAFLLGLWRDGALVGATPEQAFFVKCDEETNPKDRVDQGIVTVELGAAPVKPAEFVIIRVRQSSDSSSVSE